MNQRVFVAVGTLLVFGAGFGAAVWMQHHRPPPPPPGPFGWEFSHNHSSGAAAGFRHEHSFNRADLIAHVESLRPQLEAFRAKMDEIDAQFDRDVDAILPPDERARHDEHVKRMREGRDQKEGPLSDDRLARYYEHADQTVLWDVIIPLRLDAMTREYKLDDEQREKVRALLKVRRAKVLDLVDSSPPPTVTLFRLLPFVQRLAHPDRKSDAK